MTFRRSNGYFGSDTRMCYIYKTIIANNLLQTQLNIPIALNARYIKLKVMEAEDEVDDELSEAADTEANHNNNLENFETMKISPKPVSERTSEKDNCPLVCTSNPEQSKINDSHDDNPEKLKTSARTESKIPLSTSTKTDTKEGEIARLCKSKRISCQDTIHEYDEEDNLTMDRVGRYLEAHPALVETWLQEKASLELRQRLQNTCMLQTITPSAPSVQQEETLLNRGGKRNSVTSDLFQTWLASSSPVKRSKSPNRTHTSLMGRREELGRLDESDLFMELIRDVANELDINVLCHKILVNVGLLTHADRGSLFLAKGPLEDRYLVAKLFDVTQDTELEEAMQRAKNEEIKIPFGVGIAGYVAQTKEIINIKDAYKASFAEMPVCGH